MITMIQGEAREVGVEFSSSNGTPIAIGSATYKISDATKRVVAEGSAQIFDSKVILIYNGNDLGLFCVNFTVTIGSEVYCPQVLVKVS